MSTDWLDVGTDKPDVGAAMAAVKEIETWLRGWKVACWTTILLQTGGELHFHVSESEGRACQMFKGQCR